MSNKTEPTPPRHLVARVLTAGLLLLLVAAYTIGVVTGVVPQGHRIDASHLGIIVVTAVAALLLLRPDLAERLQRVEGAGFKLEMLRQVREQLSEQEQALKKQEDVIDDISLDLPLLLSKGERKHLMKLKNGRAHGYRGRGSLRSEIRRLRSIGLLDMLPGRTVGQMETGTSFNLADYVRLTELGRRWVERIEQIEAKEAAAGDAREENDDEP